MTRGLHTSDEFAAYLENLRRTWPPDPELAAKHGVPAGNGQSLPNDPMRETTSSDDAQTTEQTDSRGFRRGNAVAAVGGA